MRIKLQNEDNYRNMTRFNSTSDYGATFVLSSVINHIGERSTSGHYNIVIYDEANNKFILLDDSEIVDNVIIDNDMAEQSYVAAYKRI